MIKPEEQVGVTDGAWLRELKARGTEVLIGPVPPQARGFWMSRRDDAKPTVAEHDSFYPGLASCLDAAVVEDGRVGTGSAAYIRGDFFGERSEEMYIYGERCAGRVDVLASAVRAVQRHLARHPQWRVIVPLGEGPEFAMILYPTKIFFGAQEIDEAALVQLLGGYVLHCASQTKEKRLAAQARLDAVAPQLPAAVQQARASRSSVFVADVLSDYGPGVWIVHPEKSGIAVDVNYRFEPRCYRCETHALDGAGCILGEESEPPQGGGLLALWAPAERGARTIRMTCGDFTARWTIAAG